MSLLTKNPSGQSKDAVDWKAITVFVGIAFSSQCGGGFAAGNTPWSYFEDKGYAGVFMPILVAVINCFMLYFSMKFAMDYKLYDYNGFLKKYTGKYSKLCCFIYEINFNWLLIVCMALAYSTSGSVLSELFGIPYLLTTFIVGILMFVLVTNGTDLVRKNAVVMSAVIFVALLCVHVPNLIYNISSGRLASQTSVLYQTTYAASNNKLGFILNALLWGYIFSGQNLAGFGAYVNHAQIFPNKKTLWRAVLYSVILNFIFLAISNLNLTANYEGILDSIKQGKSVYTLTVVQSGVGNIAFKNILLTLISVAIFFATISTAINYVAGFNDRILGFFKQRSQETEEVFARKKHKRIVIVTILYIVLTWGVSQMGLTALVSKGLTISALLNIFTLIIPTIVNVIRGWEPQKQLEQNQSQLQESK